MVYFDWINDQWFYKQRTDTWALRATNMDDTTYLVGLFNHTVSKKSVVACQ